MCANDPRVYEQMRQQTDLLKKIERHLRPKVADARPIVRYVDGAGNPTRPPSVPDTDDEGFHVIGSNTE